MQSDIALWRTQSQKQSIFPLLEKVFDAFSDIQSDMYDIQTQLMHITKILILLVYLISSVILMDLWRIKYLVQPFWVVKNLHVYFSSIKNSDELRAGGGFQELLSPRIWRRSDDAFSFQDIYALDWHLMMISPISRGINRFKSLDYPGNQ